MAQSDATATVIDLQCLANHRSQKENLYSSAVKSYHLPRNFWKCQRLGGLKNIQS